MGPGKGLFVHATQQAAIKPRGSHKEKYTQLGEGVRQPQGGVTVARTIETAIRVSVAVTGTSIGHVLRTEANKATRGSGFLDAEASIQHAKQAEAGETTRTISKYPLDILANRGR